MYAYLAYLYTLQISIRIIWATHLGPSNYIIVLTLTAGTVPAQSKAAIANI